jgi:hypothetical protein
MCGVATLTDRQREALFTCRSITSAAAALSVARVNSASPRPRCAHIRFGGPAQASCSEVREIAAHHLERVRAKMADLAQLESLLATTIDRCEGDGAASCAVIELLANIQPLRCQNRSGLLKKAG